MPRDSVDERLERELGSFQNLWRGGFYLGDPLDPGFSPDGPFGFIGVPHAIYLTCIKPYVRPDSVVVEIGPGRGAWTKTMLHARAITCLDALSAEHNQFHEYVGRHPHVTYHQVSDFSCSMLPDDTFTYLFSYDALCHVSFDGISAYARSLHRKLRPGAHGFLMVADYAKYNAFLKDLSAHSVLRAFAPRQRLSLLRKLYARLSEPVNRLYAGRGRIVPRDANESIEPTPGRWYHAGVDRTCTMLAEVGYTIVDPDVGADPRSPIIHFTR